MRLFRCGDEIRVTRDWEPELCDPDHVSKVGQVGRTKSRSNRGDTIRVKDWNENIIMGATVRYYDGPDADPKVCETSSEAFLSEWGAAVILDTNEGENQLGFHLRLAFLDQLELVK